MSRHMKETAPGTFLVWDEPLPIGRTFASGSAVYAWRDGRWTCDGHRACLLYTSPSPRDS